MPDILSYLRSFRHLLHMPDGDGKLLQRFRLQRDELAFATLVQRHGPMVLGIAQRILGQSDLLDDVFQATFLVLAKRGKQMETWPSVAGWLVQVARRTALQARAKSARRTRHEQQAAAMTANTNAAEPADIVSQRDLSQLLDAELARLPSRYRTPLVLCHLEGQTKEETARQLGWPVGSVSGRLARGKKLLQARLLRRGIVPALATGIFTMPAANAHLPSLLIQATTLLATNVVHQTSQVSASTAVVLAQGVMTSMLMTKVKYAAAVLLVLGLCLGTGAWAWHGQEEHTTAPVPRNDAKAVSLLEQLQGAWEVVNLTDGKGDRNIRKGDGKSYWIFRGLDLFGSKVPYIGVNDVKKQIKLNESVSPCQIDYEFQAQGQNFKQYWKGIIKLQDGILTVTLVGDPRQERPKAFESGVDVFTYTLRRANDYDRLEGIWRKEERNPVTDELVRAEELIFKKNMYVERRYTRNGTTPTELGPYVFSINEATTPKQLDLEIRDAEKCIRSFAEFYRNPGSIDRDSYVRNSIDGDKDLERRLAIYELKGNEFKYVITGAIPFKFENGQLVLNTQSHLNKRAPSFASAVGPVVTYKRVQHSLKDNANTKWESPFDPRFKPPTGIPNETPIIETKAPSSQLQDLRQQRLKVAQERMKLWQEGRKPGARSMDELEGISRQVLDASLALAVDKSACVQAMEEHLKVLKQMEELADTQVKSGTKPIDALLTAQLRRIEFAIQLEELKEKR